MTTNKLLTINHVIIVIYILLLYTLNYVRNNNNTDKIVNNIEEYIWHNDSIIIESLTKKIDIKKEAAILLIKHEVEHPDIVLRQMLLESGYFTSILFIKYNNCIGMNNPKVRHTTSIGQTEGGFAIYNSLEDCIIDYKLWQSWTCKGLTKDEYLKYLDQFYAEDRLYLYKLSKMNLE